MMRELKPICEWGFGSLLVAIVLATAEAHAAVPVVVGGELLGATGVNVGGAVYDVDFVEGSCIDVYGGCDDVSDFPFTTLADATLAAQALLDQVLRDTASGDFDTFPDQVFGCAHPTVCGAQTPFALPDATNATIASAVNSSVEESDSVAELDWERALDTGTGNLQEFATWVVWTPVPPATPNVVLGELKGAFNVNVGGTLYDVEFVEGTCIDVYGGCDDGSDFRFTTVADATLAANALLDQVLLDSAGGDFDTFPAQVFGCAHPAICGAQTPFALPDPTNVTIVSAINSSAETSDAPAVLDWDRAVDTGTDNLQEFATWVIWTPVPTATPNVVLGELKGASNVDVDGVLYDVDFVEGACVDVYAGCDDVSDFPFASVADATIAAQALLDHVLRDTASGDFDSFPDQVFGCAHPTVCGAQTPFALPDALNVTLASAVNSSAETSDAPVVLDRERALDTGTDTLHEFAMYVVWTLVGADDDGDGIPNGSDNCPAIANAGQGDADSDAVGDACDMCPGSDDGIDADGDGVPDGCDICLAGDDNMDSDGDAVPDACDVCAGSDDAADADGDGVPDGCDLCLAGDDNVDSDGDAVPDACDVCLGADDSVDGDGDGVADGCDNCPVDFNEDQSDLDEDGMGDVCDVGPTPRVPGLQDWGVMALVILLVASSLVMTRRERRGVGSTSMSRLRTTQGRP
jgi:hypothetical protein